MINQDVYSRYASMTERQLQQACLFLAGTLPQDHVVGRKLDVALITLRHKMEEGEFYEFLRGVNDIYTRMKAA